MSRENGYTGAVALVGAGEYLSAMDPVDRALLARLHDTPRVVVLPTASAPDGPGVPERWTKMGVDHFTRLGAEVQPVMLLDRQRCRKPGHRGADRRRQFRLFLRRQTALPDGDAPG